MPDINLLDNNTIDKIAAGEVVENPASIVKELIENSMDSGATSITIEIKDGGIEFIRVTDNGSGISKDNIKKAFLRHATSKINSIDDLFIIKSMGFRGEALASISSVAKVEMITKTKDSFMGYRYVIEGSEEKEFEEIGAPDGTSIIVRNLFYNTPARRKFLKSSTAEANYITDIIQNLSLCRPDISFNYIVNSKPKYSSSGNNDLKEIIYRLYGREIINEIIPIDVEDSGIKVKGYLGSPAQNRASRSYETYFINNRLIKSKDIFNGIEEGYKAYTMQHKFPFCVLHFSIDTNTIDINVHPQKKEVRFLNKDELSIFIKKSIEDTLSNNEMITNVSLNDKSTEKVIPLSAPEPFEIKRLSSEVITKDNDKPLNESLSESQDFFGMVDLFDTATDCDIDTDSETNTDSETDTDLNKDTDSGFKADKQFQSDLKLYNNIVVDNPKQSVLFEDDRFISENSRREYKIIGQIFNTYWIIELKDKIYFVDQHAAHEKVNYERLMKRVENNNIESQILCPPIVISLRPKERNVLDMYLDYFIKLGFEIEEMGLNEIGLRAVPLELFFNNARDMFNEVLEELSKYPLKDKPEAITKRVATMACKASVKGGMSMTVKEIEVLLDELLLLDNPYHCPHGRPTIFAMTQYELEKKFKRIID